VFSTLLLLAGCSWIEPAPAPLAPAEQALALLGPVAQAWRDFARSAGSPGEAAIRYRELEAALGALELDPTGPAGSWRDLLVATARRDAGWAETLAAGEPVARSEHGPASLVRSLSLGGAPSGEVAAAATAVLESPPWADWDPVETPWLVAAGWALDATPPFEVDAHWGPWQARDANRQVAGVAFGAAGKGAPSVFVQRIQAMSGPSPLRPPLGCDAYRDVAGEIGPPSPLPAGPTQLAQSEAFVAAAVSEELEAALAAVGPLVDSLDVRCPGRSLLRAGLEGRLLLRAGDARAEARLLRAVEEGRSLLGALEPGA